MNCVFRFAMREPCAGAVSRIARPAVKPSLRLHPENYANFQPC